jgi:hypothetical protein
MATNESPMNLSATVQSSNVDGCHYILTAVDPTTGESQQYVPVNMDSTLLKDGNVVKVTGSILTDSVGICMAGPLLQISSASLVSPSN